MTIASAVPWPPLRGILFRRERGSIIGEWTLHVRLLNLVLMWLYEMAPLPLRHLVVGSGLLWALGQLAVLHPALRAAAVPPVVATRTV